MRRSGSDHLYDGTGGLKIGGIAAKEACSAPNLQIHFFDRLKPLHAEGLFCAIVAGFVLNMNILVIIYKKMGCISTY